MSMILVSLGFVSCAVLLAADTKTEENLRQQLAAAESARLQAVKDKAAANAALAAALTKLSVSSAKSSTSANQVNAQNEAGINAVNGRNVAENNGEIAKQAAAMALQAAEAARQQAAQFQEVNERNSMELLITTISGFFTLLAGFFYKSWTDGRQHKWAVEAADRADRETKASLRVIKQTGDDTHTLVNNNMAIQLRLNATSARNLANVTHSADDIKLAEDAEAALADHLRKQVVVDRNIEVRRKEEEEEERKKEQ